VSNRLRFRRWLGARIRSSRSFLNDVATIGPDDAYAAAFFAFGRGAGILAPQGTIYNERYIALGENTLVGPHVTLSVGVSPEQEMLHAPVLSIGRRCIIGRGSHLVGHWSIELGDDIQVGPNVYITDQNHSYDDPSVPIGQQPGREAAVVIGSGSWIGTNVVILPGTHLGQNTTVAAGAVVRGSFPDHVVLGGVPARVLRHYDHTVGWREGAAP
jgi:acetyltransferase-like isoleucine patch superfamily enzyme